MKRKKALLFWSGGKDSALSLFELKCPEWEVAGLVTTCYQTESGDRRVQTSDLPLELIQAQASSLQLPLHEVVLPENPSNEIYEKLLAEKAEEWRSAGVAALAFGDLHLEDIKNYRDALCIRLKLKSLYPIWEWETDLVVKAFGGLGHQGLIHCIDPKKIPPAFLGRMYNASVVDDFPGSVEPCGERGEFHTFVFDGPFFQKKISFTTGPVYQRKDFLHQELLLKNETQARHN